jgi:oligosaccharide repeat unit polymerase
MVILAYFLLLGWRQIFLRKKTPALLLLGIYCLSLLGSVLLQPEISDLKAVDVVNIIFLGVVLTLLIMPWSHVDTRTPITITNEKRLYRLSKCLLILNGLVFLVMLVCIYYGFTTVQDYSAIKNDGDADLLFQSIPINHYVVLFSLYACPSAFFLLPLHFLYLKTRQFKLSILCLLFSVNVVLQGLTVFSRSGFLDYFFSYFFYLSFFHYGYSRKIKRFLHCVFAGVTVVLAVAFFVITNNRFTQVLLYTSGDSDSLLKSNPIVYSIIDYGSQWYHNCISVMSMYSFNPLFGKLSFPLPELILDKLGFIDFPSGSVEATLSDLWSTYYDKFNGITANLLVDFGYFGTLLFAFCYRSSILALGRTQDARYSFERIVVLGVPFLLVATGIFNYQMKGVYYNILILYSACFYIYLNKAEA